MQNKCEHERENKNICGKIKYNKLGSMLVNIFGAVSEITYRYFHSF